MCRGYTKHFDFLTAFIGCKVLDLRIDLIMKKKNGLHHRRNNGKIIKLFVKGKKNRVEGGGWGAIADIESQKLGAEKSKYPKFNM